MHNILGICTMSLGPFSTIVLWNGLENRLEWNTSKRDIIGPQESVLIMKRCPISDIEVYKNTVVRKGKCVLLRELSLIQGCPFGEVPLYHS